MTSKAAQRAELAIFLQNLRDKRPGHSNHYVRPGDLDYYFLLDWKGVPMEVAVRRGVPFVQHSAIIGEGPVDRDLMGRDSHRLSLKRSIKVMVGLCNMFDHFFLYEGPRLVGCNNKRCFFFNPRVLFEEMAERGESLPTHPEFLSLLDKAVEEEYSRQPISRSFDPPALVKPEPEPEPEEISPPSPASLIPDNIDKIDVVTAVKLLLAETKIRAKLQDDRDARINRLLLDAVKQLGCTNQLLLDLPKRMDRSESLQSRRLNEQVEAFAELTAPGIKLLNLVRRDQAAIMAELGLKPTPDNYEE